MPAGLLQPILPSLYIGKMIILLIIASHSLKRLGACCFCSVGGLSSESRLSFHSEHFYFFFFFTTLDSHLGGEGQL